MLAKKLLQMEVIFKEDLVQVFGERPWGEKELDSDSTTKKEKKEKKDAEKVAEDKEATPVDETNETKEETATDELDKKDVDKVDSPEEDQTNEGAPVD